MSTRIESIQRFKTSDGVVHNTIADAIKHQRTTNLLSLAQKDSKLTQKEKHVIKAFLKSYESRINHVLKQDITIKQ